jgi:hypothetical protein
MKQGHCFVFPSTTLSHANETRGDQNKHGFEAEFHAKFYHRIYLRLTLFCRFSNKKKTY